MPPASLLSCRRRTLPPRCLRVRECLRGKSSAVVVPTRCNTALGRVSRCPHARAVFPCLHLVEGGKTVTRSHLGLARDARSHFHPEPRKRRTGPPETTHTAYAGRSEKGGWKRTLAWEKSLWLLRPTAEVAAARASHTSGDIAAPKNKRKCPLPFPNPPFIFLFGIVGTRSVVRPIPVSRAPPHRKVAHTNCIIFPVGVISIV